MAVSLKSIKSGRENKPPRILLYGTDGIGKSTFGANALKPIFTQTEDRLSHLNVDKFPLCQSYDDVLEQINVLYNEDHDYGTYVIDSLDWLERLIHKDVVAKAGASSIGEIPYGRGYIEALDYFSKIIRGLEALRNERNMILILICHAEIKRFEDPVRESYDQYRPSLHNKAAAMFQQWVDCIFFANFKVSTRKEKEGFGKEKAKGVGRGERIIYAEERPAFEAKNSYGLDAEFPLSWEAFDEQFLKYLERESV